MNSNKNLMNSKMKYILSLICLIGLFCSALTSEPEEKDIPTRFVCWNRLDWTPDPVDYTVRQPYIFCLVAIPGGVQVDGMKEYYYTCSPGADKIETYLARFYKGTKFEESKPVLDDLMHAAADGDREALLIQSALAYDAYKQVAAMANYSTVAFDPTTNRIILLRPSPEDENAASYTFGDLYELRKSDPWIEVMADGFFRSRSDDAYWLAKPDDKMYEQYFHRHFMQKWKEVREAIDLYNKQYKK